MSHSPPDHRNLLRQEGSDLSDAPTLLASLTLPHQRHGYHRMNSQGSVDFPYDLAQPSEASNMEENGQGLGITGAPRSLNRVPVGSRSSLTPPSPSKPFTPLTSTKNSPMTPRTPGSSRGFLSPSPAWQRYEPGNHNYGRGLDPMREIEEQDISRGETSFNDSVDVSFEEGRPSRSAQGDDYNDSKYLLEGCPSTHDIHSSRQSWLSISILMLSIYSTIFSGIWLMLAIVQPRYGRTIHSGGSLTPSTASTLFALFAKTIELSFVTVFVTFLGQVLSRRSIVKASRGVTIPELTMRTWVIQPGFMITHYQHLRHAGLTLLGVITLTAAIVATFYTTASDALVSPHLKYGHWEQKNMSGLVQASYANKFYVEDRCETPITTDMDPTDSTTTCLAIEHAGQAYHNSLAYLETWAAIGKGGEGAPTNLAGRPPPVGMLYDNTTVTGSWVATNQSNVTAAYINYGRVINNVTMSMPHAGVFSAAHDPKNGILQPEDLDGLGEYSIRASVVSPSVNVLCANMEETELKPLIYTLWPDPITNDSSIPGQQVPYPGYQNDVQLLTGQSYLNSTVVDDLFQWGAAYARQPPIFGMLPIDYNSLINITAPESDSIYMLIKSSTISNYTLCQIRSFLSPVCSTRYNVSGTNEGSLSTNCEDPNDHDAYDRSVPDAPVITSKDWRDVGSEWALSLSLNDGISNANSSTARLLSQLVLTTLNWQGVMMLNPLLPSISEALAVMVGDTLLLSTTGATYYHYWDYTSNILDPGTYLSFNSSLSSQQYTSGVLQKWQGMFYVVLLLVFATNVFCLVYFFLRSGLVTDYTEPQNLFALAVNSPPSERLRGSCGAGPESDQLNVPFHVGHDDDSNHFFIKENDRAPSEYELRRRRERHNLQSMSSYSKLSSKRTSFL